MIKFSERFYRVSPDTDRWHSSIVKVDTTDIYLRSDRDLSAVCEDLVREYRNIILTHIDRQPEFLHAFTPVRRITGVSGIISSMYDASEAAGVGPMAAVAGAINMYVAQQLYSMSSELIIENGGDILLKLKESVSVDIFSGKPDFSGKALLKIKPEETPCGICTSSARIGPSFSFGKADSVTVVADDPVFADAAATSVCSMVLSEDDAGPAVERALSMGVSGVVIIMNDTLAAAGKIEFTGI